MTKLSNIAIQVIFCYLMIRSDYWRRMPGLLFGRGIIRAPGGVNVLHTGQIPLNFEYRIRQNEKSSQQGPGVSWRKSSGGLGESSG
jgi:hypothetical protein